MGLYIKQGVVARGKEAENLDRVHLVFLLFRPIEFVANLLAFVMCWQSDSYLCHIKYLVDISL